LGCVFASFGAFLQVEAGKYAPETKRKKKVNLEKDNDSLEPKKVELFFLQSQPMFVFPTENRRKKGCHTLTSDNFMQPHLTVRVGQRERERKETVVGEYTSHMAVRREGD